MEKATFQLVIGLFSLYGIAGLLATIVCSVGAYFGWMTGKDITCGSILSAFKVGVKCLVVVIPITIVLGAITSCLCLALGSKG